LSRSAPTIGSAITYGLYQPSVYWCRISNGSKNVADTDIHIFEELVALQVAQQVLVGRFASPILFIAHTTTEF